MQTLVFESTECLTQEQFARFAADRESSGERHHYELLNGRVVMNPPAGYPHGRIGSNIQFILSTHVRRARCGIMFDSSQGFDLPSGDTVEPDHAFVSNERWTAAPSPEVGRFLRVVPDLVFEVLSSSTASQDRGEKKAIYERNGVREYWLVDSRAQNVVVFAVTDGARYDAGRTFGVGEGFSSQVLVGLDVEVDRLFE